MQPLQHPYQHGQVPRGGATLLRQGFQGVRAKRIRLPCRIPCAADLYNTLPRQHREGHDRTLRPSHGKPYGAYVNTVAQRAAIDPDKELRTVDKEDLIRMVAAMSYVENGVEADMHEVVDGWILVNECPS